MSRKITTTTPHGSFVEITESGDPAFPIGIKITNMNGNVTTQGKYALNTAWALHTAFAEYFGNLFHGECELKVEEL